MAQNRLHVIFDFRNYKEAYLSGETTKRKPMSQASVL